MEIEASNVGYAIGAFISVPLAVQSCRHIQPLLFNHGCAFGLATLISAFVLDKIFEYFAVSEGAALSLQARFLQNLLSIGTATLISLLVAPTLGVTFLASTAAKIAYLSYAGGLVGSFTAQMATAKPSGQGSTN